MNRNMTLAAVLAILPMGAACGQSTPDTAVATDEPVQTVTGIAVGEAAPAVTALTANGEAVSFDALSGTSGTVLVFTRSAEWCPFCQEQLIQMKDAKDALASEGWNIAAISYDTPEVITTFAAKHDITYPLLSDTDSETIKRWGLLNEEMTVGTRYYGIPHPTVAYVSADGTLLRINTDTNFRVRPSTQDVIDAATGLSAKMDGAMMDKTMDATTEGDGQ